MVPATGEVPVVRSLAAPGAIGEIVGRRYNLDVVDCVLLRSFVNDVYEVTTRDRRYVLKVYQHGGWSAQEVAWELELVRHLAATGVAVPRVLRAADGEFVGVLATPEGPRPFALSEHVQGQKPQPPFDHDLYRAFGRLVARFHTAGDGFRTARPRRPFDLACTLDEPLNLVLPRLADRPEARRLVRDLAAEARLRVTNLARGGLDWGICHGDVSLDNVLVTGDSLTLYDFDLAGEHWRAADLAGVRSTAFWDAFAAGYTALRDLRANDLAAVPWLRVIGAISNLRFHLVDKPALRGLESVGEGWVDRELADLRAIAGELL